MRDHSRRFLQEKFNKGIDKSARECYNTINI